MNPASASMMTSRNTVAPLSSSKRSQSIVNSSVAFLVTFLFPWELENFGNATTFLIYGVIAVIGLVFVMRILPETKGRSLEELETILVKT